MDEESLLSRAWSGNSVAINLIYVEAVGLIVLVYKLLQVGNGKNLFLKQSRKLDLGTRNQLWKCWMLENTTQKLRDN